jgi:hypothetical protein
MSIVGRAGALKHNVEGRVNKVKPTENYVELVKQSSGAG